MDLSIILFGSVLLIFVVLDVIMLISLLKPGDERNQIVVWKASSFTLFAIIGAKVVRIIVILVQAQPMIENPLVQLEVAAIIYFAALMYYRKRHGG